MANVTLRLLSYNNYYNRIVKKEKQLSDYDAFICDNSEQCIIDNVNFIPNDGINTTHVMNWGGKSPDYVVVSDEYDTKIISRWFVIEADRTRMGQYQLTLHRDVMVDFYDKAINAPCFIEKAMLKPYDPFIFNSENMTFNQIKSKEETIEDNLSPKGVAWLCGYVAANADIKDITIPNPITVDINGRVNIPQKSNLNKDLITFDNFDQWGYTTYIKFIYNYDDKGNASISPLYEFKLKTQYSAVVSMKRVDVGSYPKKKAFYYIPLTGFIGDDTQNQIDNNLKAIMNKYVKLNNTQNAAFELFNEKQSSQAFVTSDERQEMENQNGKIVLEENQYFILDYNGYVSKKIDTVIDVDRGTKLNTAIQEALRKLPYRKDIGIIYDPGDLEATSLYINTPSIARYTLEGTSLPGAINKLNLSNRGHLSDQPFDMLAIPYPTNGSVDIHVNNEVFQITKKTAINTAMEIVRSQGAEIYDMQLLPYCPMREIFNVKNGENIIDVTKYIDRLSYIYGDDGVTKMGIVLFPNVSREKFTIPYKGYAIETDDALEKKVKVLTKFHRLCSPGFNSIFEFNAEKNGGIPGFNVYVDFKPISPYIHIAPIFGALYGTTYNDMRGLTCTEDFSVSRIESAFVDFELRNKNYQNIFNRDIEDLENKYQVRRTQDIFSGVIGAFGTGIATGAGTGSTIAGLGAGGKAGLSAMTNIYFNEQLHLLDIDHQKDKFGMQLENIKALPNTIAKISAFCQNNKVFPVLELYECTTEEADALRNKLEFNGMTVGRIGTINNFIDEGKKQYVQGQLIRLENLSEDYHLQYALAVEIQNGVYI